MGIVVDEWGKSISRDIVKLRENYCRSAWVKCAEFCITVDSAFAGYFFKFHVSFLAQLKLNYYDVLWQTQGN